MTALNAKFLLRTRYLSSFLSPASFSSPVYRVQSETNVVRSVRTFTRVYVSFDFTPITREIGSSSCLSICAQSCSVGLSIYLRSFISPTFTCIVRVPAPRGKRLSTTRSSAVFVIRVSTPKTTYSSGLPQAFARSVRT